MNISMQLAVVVAAACLCLAEAAPEGRMMRTKQQRPTRGFKNVEMMTARGFGKRDRPPTRTERDVGHQSASDRSGRGVPTFKSPTVGIARDFGKRTSEQEGEDRYEYTAQARRQFNPKSSLLVANDFGKRSSNDDSDEVYGLNNFWEKLDAAPERETEDISEEKGMESIPLDWFVNEMIKNPEFARSVVRKFIDLNQDDVLTSDEMLRNVV